MKNRINTQKLWVAISVASTVCTLALAAYDTVDYIKDRRNK